MSPALYDGPDLTTTTTTPPAQAVWSSMRRDPLNSTPMGVNPISSDFPHVRPMGVYRTSGEPDKIKKNTRPKYITALFRALFRSPFVYPRRRGGVVPQRELRKVQLLHPATPYHPFPRRISHTMGNMRSFTVG